MEVKIVGAGGIGSWLLPILVRLHNNASRVLIIDQDRFTLGNMSRQLFNPENVGQFKAEVLAKQHEGTGRIDADNRWFDPRLHPIGRGDVVFGCVDNNETRVQLLIAVDEAREASLICGGNEKFSADAWYYHPRWRGTDRDPRVYSPEILRETGQRPEGCGALEAAGETQIVTANVMAASFMGHLSMLWVSDRTGLTPEQKEQVNPYHYSSSLTDLWVRTNKNE